MADRIQQTRGLDSKLEGLLRVVTILQMMIIYTYIYIVSPVGTPTTRPEDPSTTSPVETAIGDITYVHMILYTYSARYIHLTYFLYHMRLSIIILFRDSLYEVTMYE